MKLLYSQTVHHFFYFGGLFSCAVCTLGVFFFKEEAIDGMIAVVFWSFISNLFLYFVFSVKKMVEENMPDQKYLNKITVNIDREKWKKEIIKNERERLLTPGLGFIVFLCSMGARNSEISDIIIAKIILYLIAIFFSYAILEVLTGYPKPTKKYNIVVE